MIDREAMLPLAVGSLVSLAVQALLIGALPRLGEQARDSWWMHMREQAEEEQPDAQEPPEQSVLPGNRAAVSTINLVSWEDYRRLAGLSGEVEQPAVQRDVEPTPEAQRTPVDPTPATPAPAVAQAPPPLPAPEQPQPPEPVHLPSIPGIPANPAPPLAKQEDDSSSAIAAVPAQPGSAQPLNVPTAPPEPAATPPAPPTPASPPAPAVAEDATSADTQVDRPKPTMAQRGELESEPVTRLENLSIHPGGVESFGDVTVNTVRPRFHPTALMATAPRNPIVDLMFNEQGKVINVHFKRSSGYANVDTPIRASLYQWTIQGHGGRLFIMKDLRILLGVVPEDEEQTTESESE